VVIALALVLSTGVGAAEAAYAPPGGAVFNTPRPWGTKAQRYRIVRTVDAAIRNVRRTAADPHPVIYISLFLLDDKPSVDALIGARNRGVSVRVVLDPDIIGHQSMRLTRALNHDNVGRITADPADPSVPDPSWGPDRSYVLRCNGSCRGGGGNVHTKFYAFSHTGSVKNVVMVSSSNLNKGGALNGWNDLFVMRQRPKTFAYYAKTHAEMTAQLRAGSGKDQFIDGPFTTRFFPMRNASKATDPTMQDLNKIRCHSSFGRTRINVSMFYWQGTRGAYLASKLISLARDGCAVSVIYGAPSKEVRLQLRAAAVKHLINVYDSRWDLNADGAYDVRTHGKYVLIKGTYAGNRSAHVVMTGSQNWVGGSLTIGDEVTLNIALTSAYNRYIHNWEVVRNHSRRIPQHR
jgi:phosphatidylserine/phosphatidylglycerophosphate/cardiolipin synthase-like enzyme